MATTKLWTVEEVERLPDDHVRYAVIEGVLYRMPPTMPRHGRIVMAIGSRLYRFVAQRHLGAVYDQSGFILARNPDVLLSPDLAFVQTSRVPANEDTYPFLAPDLVIEIASPSQTGPSIQEKVSLYLTAGVRLIWVIDPSRREVRIHRPDGSEDRRTEQDALDGENVLPGFTVGVARLFS